MTWYVDLCKENVEKIKAGIAPKRVLSTVISSDSIYEGVKSPIDGHIFKDKRDYNEYKKRHNLATYGD